MTTDPKALKAIEFIRAYADVNECAQAEMESDFSDALQTIETALNRMEPVADCEVCKNLRRINCSPDEDGHTHPCDDCRPEALAEFNRGMAAEEFYANQLPEGIEQAQEIVRGTCHPRTKPLIKSAKDEDGNEVMIVAKWYWEEINALLEPADSVNAKCEDCGATMIEVCSGLEGNLENPAACRTHESVAFLEAELGKCKASDSVNGELLTNYRQMLDTLKLIDDCKRVEVTDYIKGHIERWEKSLADAERKG